MNSSKSDLVILASQLKFTRGILGLTVSVFDKPKPHELESMMAQMDRYLRKAVFVPVRPVRIPDAFLGDFFVRDGLVEGFSAAS